MKFRTIDYTPFLYKEKKLHDSAGAAIYCLITIDPKYVNDEGLLQRELRHVQHWRIATIISTIPFLIFNPYLLIFSIFTYGLLTEVPFFRYWAEIDCFAKQAAYYPDTEKSLDYFAYAISTKYDIKVTKDKALKDLRKRYYG
jgi:hypothetical protein